MKTRRITLSCITVSIIAFINGCDSSSTEDISDAVTTLTFISPINLTSTYIPHTNQTECFDSNGDTVLCTGSGQDGSYLNNMPSYTDNGDGTITDNITALMWQQTSDTNDDELINIDDKMTQEEAVSYCSSLELGEYGDWRLPDIQTIYSLIDFSGQDVSGFDGMNTTELNPFIDTDIFAFAYGDASANERIIDVQWATTSFYIADSEQMFGVNFADGRIKGYQLDFMGIDKTFYVQCVRGNIYYGINVFVDNNDKTISDESSQLMWQQNDNGEAIDWEGAISYCKSSTLASHSDWRLPNAKELQSIVDYTKAPDVTNSAAIDTDYFNATKIVNEAGQVDYGAYWTGTTHQNMLDGKAGVYINFGRSLGYIDGEWMDVHGAGAQRSDLKSLDKNTIDEAYIIVIDENGEDAITHGPQGDVIRSKNYVRCVRSIN